MGPERLKGIGLIRKRDFDLDLLARMSPAVDQLPQLTNLIVTGSYAIEALTGSSVGHGDIDTNIFTKNIGVTLPQIASLLAQRDGIALYKRCDNRLEYDVSYEGSLSTRLEIQFVEFARKEKRGNLERFVLIDEDGNDSIVPIARITMFNSADKKLLLRVKSLPYAVATWVIRVSGIAKAPKRQVTERDWGHLRLLVANCTEQEEILTAMDYHPQMPKGVLATEILRRVMEEL